MAFEVGVVLCLFNTSIRENIRLGRQDASDDEVELAARGGGGARCYYIRSATWTTRRTPAEVIFLEVASVSNPIALARALVRSQTRRAAARRGDPSAVDAETDTAICRTLTTLARTRTVIFATHRLSSVAQADLILVMFNGRMVEHGLHDDLLSLGGAYAHMWDKEAGFRMDAVGSTPDFVSAQTPSGPCRSSRHAPRGFATFAMEPPAAACSVPRGGTVSLNLAAERLDPAVAWPGPVRRRRAYFARRLLRPRGVATLGPRDSAQAGRRSPCLVLDCARCSG